MIWGLDITESRDSGEADSILNNPLFHLPRWPARNSSAPPGHPNGLVIRGNVCYANRLGLYSQQLGANGQHLGNFAQAFTPLAQISAATYLGRTLSEKGEGVWR